MAAFACRSRLIGIGVLAGGLLAAFSASGAQAALDAPCAGGPIGGQGAAVEKVAMTGWTSGFNTVSKAKSACYGGKKGTEPKPAVSFLANSSGAGLRSWGAETKKETELNFSPTNGFVATAEAPNAKQAGEILKKESPETPETLGTFPVTQFALTVYANLPTGCKANSLGATGRLVLNNSTLQEIFVGAIKTWGSIKDDGDELTPASPCDSEPITVVVRGEKAGTTNVLKKYLGLINSTPLLIKAGEERTWSELSEGSLNATWPASLTPTKSAPEGDALEADKVAETPGSIGYSNLAELRELNLFSGSGNGAGTAKFWFEIENATKGKGAKLKYTYTDPSINGDSAEAKGANCAKTAYTNGVNPFPPPKVVGPPYWNGVTTSTPELGAAGVKEKDYPLCNFAYVLAYTKYSLLEAKGATEGEATTVNNFLSYIEEKKGGQSLLAGLDYSALPKAVETEVEAGAKAIEF
jgi:ABC-type phosphate transport system substrate-binding protein